MTRENFQNGSAAYAIDATPLASDYLAYMKGQRAPSETALVTTESPSSFIFADEKMLRLNEVIEQIKNTSVPVLVTGESGTGKEVLAKMIHQNSDRANQAFVAVNCAALPTALLESELFGYEKGAFTGALQRHIGKFEQASSGTLLLDEITEMDPSLQAKLLRALQEREIERIGGSGPIPVKTRIIATTNRDILAAVAKGEFRQDLFYRLHVIQLEVPPLRQRPKDIIALAESFLETYSKLFGKPGIYFSNEAMIKLGKHSWPGNVRELQNVVQRAVLLSCGLELKSADLPIEEDHGLCPQTWVSHLPIGKTLRDVETYFILETLKHHNGNRTHAAKALGISLRTLRNKINEFTAEGIDVIGPLSGKAS